MRGVLLYGRRGGAVESLRVPKSVSVPNPCFIRSSLLNEMSNNSASSSNLVLAQKAVKQLRLEASVRRIKSNTEGIKGYLTKKESEGVLHQMTWPPQSPDLNPIEMV
ncbi:hypothetical protein C0J50_2523 [Silurus asotus]|uniref:Tc1-like transposase DDE domain-containing protein n=1 Tax=Silurus asotus TaxID=30991 RepID=A0AAD5B676_SILAS|nr:hypothetical protein C0J50_2523 [Silurus asotus]